MWWWRPRSLSLGSIVALGVLRCVIFVACLFAAQIIYRLTMGGLPATGSITEFAGQVLGTRAGWNLSLLGNAVGLIFAAVVLKPTVVSFPLLLDRPVGARMAVRTSVRAVIANPVTMAIWGLIVAAFLVLGCLPLFVGLAVVMLLLGHATWHLCRRTVEA